MKLLAAVLLTAAMASGQSAKVVQLSPEDAAQAKALDADQKALTERASKFHDHIIRKYLVTLDQREGSYTWSDPEDKSQTLSGNITFTSDRFMLDMSYGEPSVHCETPEEKAKRVAAEKKAEEERAAYAKAHPTKYWKKGFGWPEGFEYSDDFRYVVPSPRPSGGGGGITSSCPIALTGN